MMLHHGHWYSLHLSDYVNEETAELLAKHNLERQVIITEAQIKRVAAHLDELKATLAKLNKELELKSAPKKEPKEAKDSFLD